MNTSFHRRCFFHSAATGLLSMSALYPFSRASSAAIADKDLHLQSKVRIAKIYLGRERASWPMSRVDLEAEVKRYEAEIARLSDLADVEFVEGGMVQSPEELAAARERFTDVSGILVLHLTMGVTSHLQGLMATGLPVMVYAQPYSGHEWHIVGGWQRQGKLIDILPSSRFADIAEAVRPFRAMHRLRETRVLHISQNEADARYCRAIQDRFGTEILSVLLPELEKAYREADPAACRADADRWMSEAAGIREPNREDILKGSTMYIAMRNLLVQYKAQAVAMNCLGMNLMDRNMGYPCLGFVRFNNQLLAGVCEADLKSTMTQLIFTYLAGRTGFVTDPVFDYSNNTITHAHCVAATQMEGPQSKPSPYYIRTHLEDNKGVSLQVKMPIGGKVSMARLIGTDTMLFSTGEAVDSPLVERGCRSKVTVRVENPEHFLENWSCGLHRVIVYGDHTRDLRRYCRFMKIRILNEGTDDLQNVPGLEWETRVHA